MARATPSAFTMRRVSVGGYTVDVRSSGNDPRRRNVVLVHGLGVSEKYFRRLATILADRYNTHSVNLPGSGDTLKPSDTLNLDELSHVLAQFMTQERIMDPVMIGHSMGCQIVARLCADTTFTIDKLVLISPTINASERTVAIQSIRLLQDALHEPLAMNRIAISDYLKFGFLRFLKTQHYAISDHIEKPLASCTKPTLIIRGENDKIVPRDWVRDLLSVIKQGSVIEILSGPHNAHYTQPVEVARVCIEFIDGGGDE